MVCWSPLAAPHAAAALARDCPCAVSGAWCPRDPGTLAAGAVSSGGFAEGPSSPPSLPAGGLAPPEKLGSRNAPDGGTGSGFMGSPLGLDMVLWFLLQGLLTLYLDA